MLPDLSQLSVYLVATHSTCINCIHIISYGKGLCALAHSVVLWVETLRIKYIFLREFLNGSIRAVMFDKITADSLNPLKQSTILLAPGVQSHRLSHILALMTNAENSVLWIFCFSSFLDTQKQILLKLHTVPSMLAEDVAIIMRWFLCTLRGIILQCNAPHTIFSSLGRMVRFKARILAAETTTLLQCTE